jgi:hypothetical protein
MLTLEKIGDYRFTRNLDHKKTNNNHVYLDFEVDVIKGEISYFICVNYARVSRFSNLQDAIDEYNSL